MIDSRLGKELVKCQVKLGIQPGKIEMMGNLNEVKEKPGQKISNQYEISTLEPLFLAYDDKLEKMEAMLTTVYEDIKEMERKSEEIVDENAFLRNELEIKCENIMQMYKNGNGEEQLSGAFQKLEFQDLKERLSLMTEENSELLEKYKEIANRYNTMKLTLEKKIQSHDELFKEFQDQQSELKNCRIEIENIKHQRDILENKLKNFTESFTHQEGEKNDVSSRLARAQNEIKLLKTQVQNLKKQGQDYEEKKMQEVEMLAKDYDSLKLKEREAFNKVIFMERELDQHREENRKLVKDIEQKNRDCDQLVKMMENYDNKVLMFQKKEENMIKIAKEQREKVQEAILEKDKAQLNEQQILKSLSTIQEKHKEEIGQQKEQYDKVIQNLKAKNLVVLDQRDHELQEVQEQLLQLQLKTEKQSKEFQNMQAENQKLSAFLKEDLHGQHDQKIGEYERRITEFEEREQLYKKQNDDRINQLSLEKQQQETNYRSLQNILSDIKTQLEQARSKNSQQTAELQSTKSRLNTVVRENQRILEEISKIKKQYESKMEYAQEEYNNKIRYLQDINQQSIDKEKSTRAKAIEQIQKFDVMEKKWKFEYESRISELEKYVLQLTSQNKILNKKVTELKESKPTREFM